MINHLHIINVKLDQLINFAPQIRAASSLIFLIIRVTNITRPLRNMSYSSKKKLKIISYDGLIILKLTCQIFFLCSVAFPSQAGKYPIKLMYRNQIPLYEAQSLVFHEFPGSDEYGLKEGMCSMETGVPSYEDNSSSRLNEYCLSESKTGLGEL